MSYYPALGEPNFLAQFNYTIGYHRGFYHMHAHPPVPRLFSDLMATRHASPYVTLNVTRINNDRTAVPSATKNASAAVGKRFTSSACLPTSDR